jgi:hypothetical protein
MKKFVTFIFALSVMVYLNGMTAYAQGRGRGQGASVSQGRSQTGRAKPDERAEHGKAEKADKDKDKKQGHAAKEARNEEKFEERIERNPALKARVETLLPAGTNLQTAAGGFKNQGQFIAALHVSRNLNIPFNQLKTQMTGSNPMSLGEAVHKLKPGMTEKQANEEAKRAERQAKVTEKTKPVS